MAANWQDRPLRMSVEEYLASEPLSEVKREYLNGTVVAMAGASERHGLICFAGMMLLGPLARKARCQLFIADMKVRVQTQQGTTFYYPDLLLSCDPQDRESPYYRRSPCLIVEVTSPSTERIDRREKFYAYAQVPGLREYLIVGSESPEVELWRRPRGEAGLAWQECARPGADGLLRLDCLDAAVDCTGFYADVPELAAAAASAFAAEKSTSA